MSNQLVNPGVNILQLNVEGFTSLKSEIILQICKKHSFTTILLQETHSENPEKFKIPGFSLVNWTKSPIYGLSTYVKNNTPYKNCGKYSSKDLEWIAVEINGVLVVNVYKPPKSPLILKNLPHTSQSCIFAGDFNCHSTEWGYHETDKNGDS